MGINNTIAFGTSTTLHRLYVKDNTHTSGSDFETWLSTHNTIVYYVLNTPTYTKIEGTLASQLEDISYALSKKTQTNISQINNDLPFIIDAETLRDISEWSE